MKREFNIKKATTNTQKRKTHQAFKSSFQFKCGAERGNIYSAFYCLLAVCFLFDSKIGFMVRASAERERTGCLMQHFIDALNAIAVFKFCNKLWLVAVCPLFFSFIPSVSDLPIKSFNLLRIRWTGHFGPGKLAIQFARRDPSEIQSNAIFLLLASTHLLLVCD